MKKSVAGGTKISVKVKSVKPMRKLTRDLQMNKHIYLMLLPVVAYFVIFHYVPMYGVIIAFKDFKASLGILGSPFVGLKHFKSFFGSIYFWQLLRNTLLINVYSLLIIFPFTIIFALLINELRSKAFKRTVQTITYMPHFISVVVICGMIVQFCGTDGLFNDIIEWLGGERISLLNKPEYFRTIYIASDLWTGLGWGTIIYIAALSGIDQELYEAARIDGASRFKQVIHITIPGIMPTIIIMLIMRVGSMMSLGWEKIILLYNPLTYDTADVISSFVYRRGIENGDYSYSAAVGLMNSVINFILLISTNKICKVLGDTSLW